MRYRARTLWFVGGIATTVPPMAGAGWGWPWSVLALCMVPTVFVLVFALMNDARATR